MYIQGDDNKYMHGDDKWHLHGMASIAHISAREASLNLKK